MCLDVRPLDNFTSDHGVPRSAIGRFHVRPCTLTFEHSTISRAAMSPTFDHQTILRVTLSSSIPLSPSLSPPLYLSLSPSLSLSSSPLLISSHPRLQHAQLSAILFCKLDVLWLIVLRCKQSFLDYRRVQEHLGPFESSTWWASLAANLRGHVQTRLGLDFSSERLFDPFSATIARTMARCAFDHSKMNPTNFDAKSVFCQFTNNKQPQPTTSNNSEPTNNQQTTAHSQTAKHPTIQHPTPDKRQTTAAAATKLRGHFGSREYLGFPTLGRNSVRFPAPRPGSCVQTQGYGIAIVVEGYCALLCRHALLLWLTTITPVPHGSYDEVETVFGVGLCPLVSLRSPRGRCRCDAPMSTWAWSWFSVSHAAGCCSAVGTSFPG